MPLQCWLISSRRRDEKTSCRVHTSPILATLVLATAMVFGSFERTSAAEADPEIRWNFASTYASTLTQLGTTGKRIERRIREISGGNIELKFREPGAIVPALEIFDAVSVGAVEAGWSTPGYWAGKIPALQLFGSVPFGPQAGEYLAWYSFGGGQALFEELYHAQNIHGIICGVIAPEASGWFREPITSPEDLVGLKMRFFGLGAKVMEKLGVSTQLLAGGDIFPALELGTIDATEFSMPAVDLKLGFYQVAKHYYFPGWHQQSTLFELIINLDEWNGLSDTQRAQFEALCGETIAFTFAEGEAIQFAALAELEERGTVIHKWSAEMLQTFSDAWDEVVKEQVDADEDFARVWNSLAEFRQNYARWKDLGYL